MDVLNNIGNGKYAKNNMHCHIPAFPLIMSTSAKQNNLQKNPPPIGGNKSLLNNITD